MRKHASSVAGTTVEIGPPAQIRQGLDAALVIGPVALVDKGHRSIALEVGNRNNGSVDWELLVVGSETVAVGIGVGEETRLEDGIGGGLDVRNEVRRREGSLLMRCDKRSVYIVV